MKRKIVGTFVCMLMFATIVPTINAMNIETPQVLASSLVTINIVARIAYIDDRYDLLGDTIKVNDTITGKYTYDTTTPDTNALPTVGDYFHTAPPCGIEVNAGGFIFKTNSSDVDFLVEIVNDHGTPTSDNYLLRSYNNVQLSNGMVVDHISWQLDDETCTALDSTALPTTAPILTDWESIFGLTIQGYDPADPYGKTYLIRAHVNKATKPITIDADVTINNNRAEFNGAENDWKTPSFYPSNMPLLQFWIKVFERIPHAFPILCHLLRY